MPDGKRPLVANTFGLPSGKSFSCPGATSVCEKICYAGKLEKVFKSTRELLLANWDAVPIGMVISFPMITLKHGVELLNITKMYSSGYTQGYLVQ